MKDSVSRKSIRGSIEIDDLITDSLVVQQRIAFVGTPWHVFARSIGRRFAWAIVSFMSVRCWKIALRWLGFELAWTRRGRGGY